MEINVLFIILTVITLACMLHGYRQGLIRPVVSVAIFFLSFLLVGLLAPVVLQLLKEQDTVYQAIREPVERMLNETVQISFSMNEMAADVLTLKTMDVLVYTVLFLLVNILLHIVAGILDVVARFPGIREVNNLAGLLLGALEALVLIWSFFLVVTLFSTTTAGKWCLQQVGESQILTFLYLKNIFLTFI